MNFDLQVFYLPSVDRLKFVYYVVIVVCLFVWQQLMEEVRFKCGKLSLATVNSCFKTTTSSNKHHTSLYLLFCKDTREPGD